MFKRPYGDLLKALSNECIVCIMHFLGCCLQERESEMTGNSTAQNEA